MERLRTDDLRRLVQVVHSDGFSAAGRVLGESPRQISRRISQLEEELGCRLLHRTTRQLSLTPEGERYYQAAVEIIAQLEQARESLSDSAGVTGRLRVRVFTMLARPFARWLVPVLQQHPGLKIEVEVDDSPGDLARSGLDLALTVDTPTHSSALVRRLGTVRAGLAAHPDYIARRGLPAHPEELAGHRCLRFAGQRTWILEHPEHGRVEVPVDDQISATDSRMLHDAVAMGMGIGVSVERDRGLVAVLPEWSYNPVPLYALIAPGRRHLRRVRLLLDGLPGILAALSGTVLYQP